MDLELLNEILCILAAQVVAKLHEVKILMCVRRQFLDANWGKFGSLKIDSHGIKKKINFHWLKGLEIGEAHWKRFDHFSGVI